MKPAYSIAVLASALMVVTACGAGRPQKAEVRAHDSLALWPMTTTSDVARQEVTDGLREQDMDRNVEAYEHFQRAIAADSTAPMAHLHAAKSAQNAKDAFAHISKAVALAAKGNDVERLIIDATFKAFKGDNEGAQAAATQLVKLDAAGPRSWILLARSDSLMGLTGETRTAFDKAIAVAPDFAPAYIKQSASYAQSAPRDPVKAEQLARKAVELEPKEALSYDALGDALRMQGKLDEAGQAYTKMAELDPASGSGLQQRGHVNTFLGKYSEARADYTAATAAATGNAKVVYAAYVPMASVHEGNMRAAYDATKQVYNGIDAMNVPGPLVGKAFTGTQMFWIAFHERMVPELEKTVALLADVGGKAAAQVGTEEVKRQQHAVDVLRQGYLALAKGKAAAAKQDAAEYMKLREPDHTPNKNEPAHALLGAVALQEKRYADAVHEYDQSDPDDMYFTYYRGVALEGAGRTDEAMKVYQKVASYYFNPIQAAIVRREALAKVAAKQHP